jgi:hypothetical protein
MGERRKRLTAELTKAFLQDLKRMAVDVDSAATADDVFLTFRNFAASN